MEYYPSTVCHRKLNLKKGTYYQQTNPRASNIIFGDGTNFNFLTVKSLTDSRAGNIHSSERIQSARSAISGIKNSFASKQKNLTVSSRRTFKCPECANDGIHGEQYLNKIELKSGLSGKCYLPKLTDREKSYYRVTENMEKMRTYEKEEQLQARYHGEYTPGAYDVQRIANLNKNRSKHGLEPLRLSRYYSNL